MTDADKQQLRELTAKTELLLETIREQERDMEEQRQELLIVLRQCQQYGLIDLATLQAIERSPAYRLIGASAIVIQSQFAIIAKSLGSIDRLGDLIRGDD